MTDEPNEWSDGINRGLEMGIAQERQRVLHELNEFFYELRDDNDDDAFTVMQCLEVVTYGHVLQPIFPGEDWDDLHRPVDFEEYGKGWRMGRWTARQELINRFREIPNHMAMTPAQVIHMIRPAESQPND
jgi:hypothetical protein